ncbi:MAG: M4 family metallopeptidase [Colwellia sp.]
MKIVKNITIIISLIACVGTANAFTNQKIWDAKGNVDFLKENSVPVLIPDYENIPSTVTDITVKKAALNMGLVDDAFYALFQHRFQSYNNEQIPTVVNKVFLESEIASAHVGDKIFDNEFDVGESPSTTYRSSQASFDTNLQYFKFGIGGYDSYPYSDSIDVVAHEYMHSVVNRKFGISILHDVEQNAVGESIADFMSAVVGVYLEDNNKKQKTPDSTIWLYGEETYKENNVSRGVLKSKDNYKAVRHLNNPTSDDSGMAFYSDPEVDTIIKPHQLSGVGSLALYKMSEEENLGMTKVSKLIWKALDDESLKIDFDYEALRNSMAKAAKTLFPGDDTARKVCRSWDAVNVKGANQGECDFTPYVSMLFKYCTAGKPVYNVNWNIHGATNFYVDYRFGNGNFYDFYEGTGTSKYITGSAVKPTEVRVMAYYSGKWTGFSYFKAFPSCSGAGGL